MVIVTANTYNEMILYTTQLTDTFNLAALTLPHRPSETTSPLIKGLIPQTYLTLPPEAVLSAEMTTLYYR